MKKEKSSNMTEERLSRSAQKRQAKQVEAVSQELVALSASEIKTLPCHDDLKQEILLAGSLKAGAKKRQTKFISKELRNLPLDPILLFLENKKGSHLKKTTMFHELERLRDAIIQETIDRLASDDEPDPAVEKGWLSPTVNFAGEHFPQGNLDLHGLQKSAFRFVRSRKPAYKKELFRALQAAQERSGYLAAVKEE